MEAIRLNLPSEIIQRLDKLVEAGVFPNRSEAIREGIRQVLRKYKG